MTTPEPAASDQDFVRPFVITRGRTRVRNRDLRVETIVQTSRTGRYADAGFERDEIIALCAQPYSIAEVSALLNLPLGVVTVLVDELLNDAFLVLHQPKVVELSLLERVIDGVQAL